MRDVIEAEVEGQLAGRDRLDREDVDAIERRVLAAKRQNRGSGSIRRAHVRSAPNLLDLATAGATQVPSAPSTAPPPPPNSLPSPPAPPASGHSSTRQPPPSRLRSSSGASQRAPTMARHLTCSNVDLRLPEPPYGVTPTDIRDDVSERSRVQVVPKYPVPKRPKLKPMDHWDLLVSFDVQKHREDSEAFQTRSKGEAKRRFKAVLDGQMVELRGLKEQEADAKRKEQEDMTATIENNKKLTQQEEDTAQAKRDIMKKANDDMTVSLEQRRQKAKATKNRERDQMLAWLANEKARKDEEERQARIEYAEKCKVAREELAAAQEEAKMRKKAEQELDKAIAAAQVKAMDKAEADNKAAVKARMDQIERNCATLGAEIAGRDARMEQDLQAKIKKVQEEADRASKEDAERRQRERKEKVDDMLQTLAKQMDEKEKRSLVDKEANKKQAAIWQEQVEDGRRKDREEAERRQKDRAKLDQMLIDQIREATSVHPRNFGISSQTQRADISYNRALFEHLSKQGFRPDVMDQLLRKVGDHGKLDPFPSVGRYEGHIDPLELQVPEA